LAVSACGSGQPESITTSPPSISGAAPPATVDTTEPSSAEITLGTDGLGIIDLADPMGDVMTTLIETLGEPHRDRTLEAPFGDEGELGQGQMACWTATGTTCIDYLRIVQ
jgi:hypothetical protein